MERIFSRRCYTLSSSGRGRPCCCSRRRHLKRVVTQRTNVAIRSSDSPEEKNHKYSKKKYFRLTCSFSLERRTWERFPARWADRVYPTATERLIRAYGKTIGLPLARRIVCSSVSRSGRRNRGFAGARVQSHCRPSCKIRLHASHRIQNPWQTAISYDLVDFCLCLARASFREKRVLRCSPVFSSFC